MFNKQAGGLSNMKMNRKTRAAVAAFNRIQNKPVMGCQMIPGQPLADGTPTPDKLMPALHAPYTVSRFTPHEQAIKEHVRRGYAMPQPSPVEQAPVILDPANAIQAVTLEQGLPPPFGGFIPLSE